MFTTFLKFDKSQVKQQKTGLNIKFLLGHRFGFYYGLGGLGLVITSLILTWDWALGLAFFIFQISALLSHRMVQSIRFINQIATFLMMSKPICNNFFRPNIFCPNFFLAKNFFVNSWRHFLVNNPQFTK